MLYLLNFFRLEARGADSSSISSETEEGREGEVMGGGMMREKEFTGNTLGYFMGEERIRQVKTKKGQKPACFGDLSRKNFQSFKVGLDWLRCLYQNQSALVQQIT